MKRKTPPKNTTLASDLDYGPVYVLGGRLKGRVLYYDDQETQKTAICYVGHPLEFCGTYDVPMRFLREPTIDELLKRREDIWRQLTSFAIDDVWDIDPSDVHALWAERALVDDTLFDRRMFGQFGQLEGRTVFPYIYLTPQTQFLVLSTA